MNLKEGYSSAWKEWIADFEVLLQWNCGKGINWFVGISVLVGFAASIASIAVTFGTGLDNFYIIIVAVAAFVGVLPLHFFLQHYLLEMKKRRIDSLVPDLLLQASAFPAGIGFGKMIGYFAHERFGLLGKEFSRAKTEIEKGSSVGKALDGIAERCGTDAIERAMLLLKQGYCSGADMGLTFREAADDLLETNAILRERNAALVVEKYTLLLAGGIIVPLVLGLLIGMVSSMDFSAFGTVLGFGKTAAERQALLNAVSLANHIYIVEYSLLAALFVASIEGNKKKAFVYASFLLPLSMLCFKAANFLI